MSLNFSRPEGSEHCAIIALPPAMTPIDATVPFDAKLAS
jgi:hypothetical protein